MSNTGIIYTTTGEHQRGVVTGYHSKPAPLFLNKTKHAVDVSGLKKSEQSKVIKFDGMEFESKFTIGFEIEKNELSRNAVKEYELFCGFERDGSCGYEAVIIGGLSLFVWLTINVLIEDFKSKKK